MATYLGRRAKGKFVEKCDALYVWHKDPVFRMAQRAVGGDREWALDLLDKCMMTAYANADKFSDEKSERSKSMMTAILQSQISEIYREAWEKIGLCEKCGAAPADPKGRFDVDQILIRNEFTAELAKYVERLANSDRELVFMRFYAGFTAEEISRNLGCSTEDVDGRIFRVKQKIAGMIKEG
ncbi:MAG: RNA polymerase sigma factor [Clostridiales bacterium]|nr:RNA polymerase sigma factor [Clostridiales bacterium]